MIKIYKHIIPTIIKMNSTVSNKRNKPDSEFNEPIIKNIDDMTSEDIIQKTRELNRKMCRLYHEITKIEDECVKLKKIRFNKCEHKFVIDHESYEPCGPTAKICTHCHMDPYGC
jgi:hypothetical protein